jgi:hypothetical protein
LKLKIGKSKGAMYLAAVVLIAIFGGGLIFAITYYCLDYIYGASLPVISSAGGMNNNEVLSTNLIFDAFASIPVILFLVCWVYILTKSQRNPDYPFGE